MNIEGAVITEQDQTFAVVIVKRHVLSCSSSAAEAQASFSRYFPGMPIVLMAQDSRGTPTYLGRKDIAKFLAGLRFNQIPWKRYSFSS